MIICSCNVITDRAIRDVVTAASTTLGSPAQVYDCLGCAVQCGLCSRSVKSILDESQSNCAQAPDWTAQRDMAPAQAPCAQLAMS